MKATLTGPLKLLGNEIQVSNGWKYPLIKIGDEEVKNALIHQSLVNQLSLAAGRNVAIDIKQSTAIGIIFWVFVCIAILLALPALVIFWPGDKIVPALAAILGLPIWLLFVLRVFSGSTCLSPVIKKIVVIG